MAGGQSTLSSSVTLSEDVAFVEEIRCLTSEKCVPVHVPSLLSLVENFLDETTATVNVIAGNNQPKVQIYCGNCIAIEELIFNRS